MSGICWDLFPDIPVLKNTSAAFAAIRKEAEDEKQRADKLKSDLDSKHKEIDRLRCSLDSKKKQVDTLQYDLDCVHDSVSFRVGRGMTYLPRKLRDLYTGDAKTKAGK